ncbi:coiled-coil domain-containing protein 38-like [Stegostoma tigrinum]|uniref:coiled-coil domain-containing protein 38-like n=1 Tax=Stegostoma tigrinum TaxID=3053191 RepID=UPI00287048EE|nr:coiled-coil domain-containing protein 38-like [Stegostoma tigrinum]XP_059510789.1 coiled-coil domain-containing protein 38-like [Stegostoma tigrinum]
MATEVITNLPSLAPASGAVDKFPLLQEPNEDEKQSQIYPFINPTNAFVFREKVKRQQKELLSAQSGPGYLRSTFTSRRKSFSSSWRRFALEQQDEDKKNEKPKPVCFVKDGSTDKAGLQEYIQQQRQLFLIQYLNLFLIRAESDLEEKPMDIKPNDSALDQELYFKDPQEILDIFFNLEEQIVSLLQHCREAEEDIDRINQKMAATQEAMRIKIFCLKNQVKQYEDTIEKVQNATADVKFQVKMFSWGDSTGEDEKNAFQQLDQGLMKLHQMCFNDSQVPEDIFQKLKNVEGEIHRLLDCIDAAATAKTVSSILKRKQKETAERLQEEMMSHIKSSMEERIKHRREAALKDTQKRLGRKLVYRSEPVKDKAKGKNAANYEIEEVNEEGSFFN